MVERATVPEMVEALLVFDEGILNSRYHGMLARFNPGPMRDELVNLPARILAACRSARAGAEKWNRSGGYVMDDGFLEWGERTLLDSFLGLVESEMRLLAYIARAAPTQAIRADFNQAVQHHQEAAKTLREALSLLARNHPTPISPGAVRGAQEEENMGDLRSQLEAAMRATSARGHAIRHITLSSTGLRHLRDQGLFQDGETTFDGTSVLVDFAWDTPGFALQSFDAIPLEEIVHDNQGNGSHSTAPGATDST
jgi:hypothetical protein